MSSLILSHDGHLILLELSVEKVFIPHTNAFDDAIMKKTILMFRFLDNEWESLSPHRRDHQTYHGSNYEEELFYGGKSVLFAIPEETIHDKVEDVTLQITLHQDISHHFEMPSCDPIDIICVPMDDLLNTIFLQAQEFDISDDIEPISKSRKRTYMFVNEDDKPTGAKITLYTRLTYFGKSIVTETTVPKNADQRFYSKDERGPEPIYQCREITPSQLLSGRWGSQAIVSPGLAAAKADVCECKPPVPCPCENFYCECPPTPQSDRSLKVSQEESHSVVYFSTRQKGGGSGDDIHKVINSHIRENLDNDKKGKNMNGGYRGIVRGGDNSYGKIVNRKNSGNGKIRNESNDSNRKISNSSKGKIINRKGWKSNERIVNGRSSNSGRIVNRKVCYARR